MTTDTRPGSSAVGLRLAPGRAVARLAVHQVRGGAVAVAVVCGVMSACVASQYQPIGDLLDESGMAALSENPAVRILSGPPVALDDPGGFAVWRTGIPVALLASVWIILVATRITRGEEDAGRWDLILASRLRVVDLVVRCLAVLVGAAALVGACVAAGLLAAGTATAGTVIYAIGIACVTSTFAMTGVLTGQLAPTRFGATALATGVLGTALALRMLADVGGQLAWLAWTTPFGLMNRTAPYAENRILPLLILSMIPVVLAGAVIAAAERRDLASGLVAMPKTRRRRYRLLHSVEGFAVRSSLRITQWWALGISAYFLVAGALLASVLELFATNSRFAQLAAAAGTGVDDIPEVFATSMFGVLAIATGLYATLQLARTVADENAGRRTLLLAQPLSRSRLISAEIAVTACGVLVLHCSAAVALWGGARITGGPMQLTDALANALIFVPVAWLAMGLAAVGVGWFPSAVGVLGALPLVGGYMINVVAQTTNSPSWIAGLSPWTHLTTAAGATFDWTAAAILVLIGAGSVAVGVYGYARRDVAT
ncbi:hypothetical protein AU197_07735 [Mycobacterium sp. IS-1590]|uniref:hypothetical protein n=1 Tax=Mycobacterium sp. IS-1590 TaxID=1772286 RepID=UPI0007495C4E|nr:hypothetical protein [Mycobacterium sp. IS-1590]KUI34541.1 hypothetical protein AU197_07735 [Mycobacterium sp. IS-1590]